MGAEQHGERGERVDVERKIGGSQHLDRREKELLTGSATFVARASRGLSSAVLVARERLAVGNAKCRRYVGAGDVTDVLGFCHVGDFAVSGDRR